MIKQSVIDDYNRRRLANLIREVSELNGGEPEFDSQTGEVLGAVFLEEYIAEVIKEWSNRLVEAIACFEDLKAQAIRLKPHVKQSKPKVSEVVTFHPAFREHYEQLDGKAGREPVEQEGKDLSSKNTGSPKDAV